jgi:hypothetical protein
MRLAIVCARITILGCGPPPAAAPSTPQPAACRVGQHGCIGDQALGTYACSGTCNWP